MATELERIAPAARAIRHLAWTYYVLAGCVTLLCLLPMASIMAREPERAATPFAWVVTLATVALLALFAVTGWGLSRVRSWVVLPAMALAAVLLFAFPLGTLIGGEALYTLVRHYKVFQQEAELIRAAPRVGEERIPRWQLVVIGLLIAGIVAYAVLQW